MLQAPPEGNPPPPNAEIPVPPPTTPATLAVSERDKVQKVVNSNDFMIWSLILVGICLLGAVVFYFLERWRKRGLTDGDSREDSLSLSNFREMYEAGEITEAEYKKVRDKLAAQMKNKLGVSAKPSTSNGLKPVLPPEPENPDREPPKPPDAN